MAFRKSGKPGLLLLWFFGEESFETNLIVVVFRLCHGRLYFDGMPLIDLWLVGFVLQLGKIVASIEQKPVSLNDIVTCRALIKTESDFWMSSVIDCNCQSVEDDSCRKAFWLLLMIFCYLCQCFCIVRNTYCPKVACCCVSAFEWAMRIVKSNLCVISFSWSKLISEMATWQNVLWLIWLLVISRLFRN